MPRGSTYLYKPRNGKLSWRPLWDFDLAWSLVTDYELGSVTGFNNTGMAWSDGLREKDPQFVELLKERLLDPETGLDARLEELTREGGVLDQYQDELTRSWAANYNRWGNDITDAPLASENLEDEIEKLRHWIDARRVWINEHLDEIGTVHYTLTYLVGEDVYDTKTARGRSLLGEGPVAPKLEGQVFLGWREQQSEQDGASPDVRPDDAGRLAGASYSGDDCACEWAGATQADVGVVRCGPARRKPRIPRRVCYPVLTCSCCTFEQGRKQPGSMRVLAHIATVALALCLSLGVPMALAGVNPTSLVGGGTDLVSSATTIQAAPDGKFYILINGDLHPDKDVLADWVTFFEGKEAAPLIMEDVSCVVCEGDAAGFEMATSLQSRLAENQMKLRTEQGVLALSKAEAGLFDVMVFSEGAFDNYGAQSIADHDGVAVIVR